MFKRKTRWHKIADSEKELEQRIRLNKGIKIQVDGKKLCLARNKQGFFAMTDRCPHQGASMSGGECSDDGYMECPWHKYRFDLNSGRDQAGLGDYMHVYKLDIRDDGVFVGFEYTAFTLFNFLGED